MSKLGSLTKFFDFKTMIEGQNPFYFFLAAKDQNSELFLKICGQRTTYPPVLSFEKQRELPSTGIKFLSAFFSAVLDPKLVKYITAFSLIGEIS